MGPRLPRPSTISCPGTSGEPVLVGAPCQRGQHGLDCRTKAVPNEAARALDILPASNMGSAVSRRAGEQSGAHPDLTLPHSLARMRAACSMPNRLEWILSGRMCARGIAYLIATECLRVARSARNLGAAAPDQRSMTIEELAHREDAAGSVLTCGQDVASTARPGPPYPAEDARPDETQKLSVDP